GRRGASAATEAAAPPAPASAETGDAKDAAVARANRDDSGPGPAGASRPVVSPSLIALVVWLVCLPVAFAAVRLLRPGNPFDLRTALIPVAVGAVALGLTAGGTPGGGGGGGGGPGGAVLGAGGAG